MPERWDEDLVFLREVAEASRDDDLATVALARITGHLTAYAELRERAQSVVAYWDSLDAVQEDDARPTEAFRAEMDARLNTLRVLLEAAEAHG